VREDEGEMDGRILTCLVPCLSRAVGLVTLESRGGRGGGCSHVLVWAYKGNMTVTGVR
jgi:hypothetical protein